MKFWLKQFLSLYVTATGGLFTFGYILEKKKMLPGKRVYVITVPLVIGTLASFTVGRFATKSCIDRWMALEGKQESLSTFLGK